ncbi:MAG: hypothetical protein HRT89_19950, partial [Lentisphaeria bacterium]|nr:hypothetical protein [Lentisphaeria bacterium]NQZ70332.1 hypothetical protein [Lentisphaeria bacterium]
MIDKLSELYVNFGQSTSVDELMVQLVETSPEFNALDAKIYQKISDDLLIEVYSLIDGKAVESDKQIYSSFFEGLVNAPGILVKKITINDTSYFYYWMLDPDEMETAESIMKLLLKFLENRVEALLRADEFEILLEEFQQTEKMASIGHLASGISHDFSNQLTCIMVISEYLYSQINDERLQKQVKTILKAANNSARLTKQLLTLSRNSDSEENRSQLMVSIIDLTDLLNHSLNRNIKLITEFSD